jgi:hypothetical protein
MLMDLVGIKMVVEFEAIEIMGAKCPYPYLLGIEWA